MVSRSLDQPLPWRARVSLRMHLMMCRSCSRFERQLHLLRRLAKSWARRQEQAESSDQASGALPSEARARLEQALDRATGKEG